MCRLLTAYEHYIPVRIDFADLVDQVDWAKENEDIVKQIAANAAKFADTHLRNTHMKVYWFRLIIEYQRNFNAHF